MDSRPRSLLQVQLERLRRDMAALDELKFQRQPVYAVATARVVCSARDVLAVAFPKEDERVVT